jgi:RNA polymerase sigma factor (sigma-70 family)
LRVAEAKDYMEEEQAIIEFENMIAWIARKFPVSTVIGFDDLMQYGRIGAMKAYRTFNPEKGRKRETWFHLRIKYEMLDALRSVNHVRSRENGASAGYGTLAEKLLELPPSVPCRHDFRTALEARLDTATLMKALVRADADLIRSRFLEESSLIETGQRIGFSATEPGIGTVNTGSPPYQVSRVTQKALAQLRHIALQRRRLE